MGQQKKHCHSLEIIDTGDGQEHPPRGSFKSTQGRQSQFNATTQAWESTVEGGGNPLAAYISLKQRAPASKYASSLGILKNTKHSWSVTKLR
jgi:hypothetical protein